MLTAAGFDGGAAREEILLAGGLEEVPRPGSAPIPGLGVRRVVGTFGARFEAVLDGEVVAFVEAQDDHTRGGSLSRLDGWADLAELHVAEHVRRRGVATWLFHHLAEWLRLGGTTRFLVALAGEDVALEPWLARFGWRRIGRCRRGWEQVVP